ncbi:MAG: primosomal protein N' [Myxococcota bacterium]
MADRPLPEVELVDMREAPRAELDVEDARENVISTQLAEAIARTLRAKEQVILFLNRRGHSPFVQCRSCGAPASCPNCSVTLTYHDQAGALRCHYCDYIMRMPEECPVCESPNFGFLGVGTEKLLGILQRAFPGARVARLDRDSGKQGLQIIRQFRAHKIDILIGTQMVTKGHDVHNVTLVGVIMADLGLNMPDFRAGERTFQILTQVAGRAGRGEKPGRVLIQTYSPWHYALEAARHQSYNQFVQHELQTRRELAYPPFASLASILFEGSDEQRTVQAARAYADVGRELFTREARWQSTVSLLGPAQAPLARLRGMFRWQILLKGQARAELRDFLGALLEANRYYHPSEGFAGVKIVVDIDPQNLL